MKTSKERINKLKTNGIVDLIQYEEKARLRAKKKQIKKRVESEISEPQFSFDKIQWTQNTNQLWKIFDDLRINKNINTSAANLMRMVIEVFVDKNGKKISLSTLETYGKKGRKSFTTPKKPLLPKS